MTYFLLEELVPPNVPIENLSEEGDRLVCADYWEDRSQPLKAKYLKERGESICMRLEIIRVTNLLQGFASAVGVSMKSARDGFERLSRTIAGSTVGIGYFHKPKVEIGTDIGYAGIPRYRPMTPKQRRKNWKVG